jgi:signal peptidase I
MTALMLELVLVAAYAAMVAYVGEDARQRGRRWIRWSVLTALFGLLALLAWLVARRRSPRVLEPVSPRVRVQQFAGAVCVVSMLTATQVSVTAFLVQVARVEGQAMAPTIQDQDRLLVNKWAYRDDRPRVGDIVMLRYPLNPDKSFVKRVIGTEGDTLRAVDGQVFRNDVAMDQSFVPAEYRSGDDWGPTVIPEGYYFVMGDHRNNSSDSRHWGFVPAKYILGRVWVRWWPVSAACVFRGEARRGEAPRNTFGAPR